MKKCLSILISICVLFSFVACSNKEKESTYVNDPSISEDANHMLKAFHDSDYVVNTTLPEINEKINNKEDMFIIMTQTECGHCHEFASVLVKYAEDRQITFLDLNLTNEEYDDVLPFLEFANVDATPAIIVVKKGEAVFSEIVGGYSLHDVEEILEAYVK